MRGTLMKISGPTLSLLERYQGAFMGVILALDHAASQFPWEMLRAIALGYDRPAYQHHLQTGHSWPTSQRMLAEMVWHSLGEPTVGSSGGESWLVGVMERWRSIPLNVVNAVNVDTESQDRSSPTQLLTEMDTLRQLVAQRAPLGQWQRHLQRYPLGRWRQRWGGSPATAGERTPLEDRDLWVILGVLARTDGDFATAIAQGQTLLGSQDASQDAIALGWIGATIGSMAGAHALPIAPSSLPTPSGTLPAPSTAIPSPRLIAARDLGTQCFLDWAGQATGNAHQTNPLTPWAITLSS